MAADVGFVGEADPEVQATAILADTLPTARTIEIPSSVQSFLKIRGTHVGSDLQIICRKFSSNEPVTFYVHREILMRKCAFFADSQNFAIVSQRSCQHGPAHAVFEEITEYDDDIVYEVLRFVYTGMLCPPYGFSRRALQLLKLIDYLGVFEMAERHLSLPNIVKDPVIGNLLQTMFVEGSGTVSASRLRTVIDEFCKGSLLGFQLQRGLILRLLELQPGCMTPELQQELIDRGLLDSKSFEPAVTTVQSVVANEMDIAVSDDIGQIGVPSLNVVVPELDAVVARPAKRLCLPETRPRHLGSARQPLRTLNGAPAIHMHAFRAMAHQFQGQLTSLQDVPGPIHVATPQRTQNQRRAVACAGC